ncbi:MCP/YpsA-like protein [Dioscorea alata]|uniref:MCP/YpsA-like protein n=1 Tax=Dioscorea alata TaxID=55571 RepID=A0ACB7VBG3_DIOAL|nr:MCP/YpsA-like protein [Dioscorea alata]
MGSPPVGMLALPPSAALSPSLGTTSIASQNHGFLRASSNFRRWAVDRRHLHHRSVLSSGQKWFCGFIRRHRDKHICSNEVGDGSSMFGSDEEVGSQVPTQAQSIVEGSGTVLVSEYKPIPDLDYLQELLAIQQQGPRAIGFFGTRNMGFMHQQLIEILSYAMVITKNHIYTSGASGTNAAVIRGALRAEKPELLTVILPQSLKMQPPESQELLSKVQNVIEKPQNDHLPLIEASRLCNMDILSHVQQVICFAFHDSRLLMETCQEAKNLRKIVTLFYLD